MKEYKCKCGKIFTKANVFNGHKSGCKIHLGKDKYNERIKRSKKGAKLKNKKSTEKAKINKEKELQHWLNEQYICEYCNKIMKKKFGSGRFCNRSCSNGWVSKNQSEQSIYKKTSKWSANKFGKRGIYKGYKCDSSWELAYVIYNLEHNIQFERNKKGFKYIYENKEYRYYPDFIEAGQYIEIKGYKTKKDDEKWKVVKNLKIMFYEDIKYMLDYVINIYGKDFIKLYE